MEDKQIQEYRQDIVRSEQVRQVLDMPGWKIIEEELERIGASLDDIDRYETLEDFKAGKMTKKALKDFVGRINGYVQKGNESSDVLKQLGL